MLTDLGKAQHYVLGASLIQRYPHLKKILKEDDERIYLRTTEFTRTKQSLEYHLLGMVEANELAIDGLSIYEDSFSKAIKDHKIYEGFLNANRRTVSHLFTRANIVPFQDDLEMLCTELKACPNSFKLLGKEKEEFLESQMRPVCEKIYKDTKIRLDGQGLRYFYDYVLANTFEGRGLPEGINAKSWAYIKHAGEYFVVFKRFGSELQRKLFSIFLSNKILDMLRESKQNTFPFDLALISAHDVTVFNLLNALNILTPEKMYAKLHENNVEKFLDFPNFASQILIELWESENQKGEFVRLIYENKVMNIGERIEEFYSFSEFENLLKASYAPYTPEDLFEQCGRENPVKQAQAPKEIVEQKVK